MELSHSTTTADVVVDAGMDEDVVEEAVAVDEAEGDVGRTETTTIAATRVQCSRRQ